MNNTDKMTLINFEFKCLSPKIVFCQKTKGEKVWVDAIR